MRNYFLFLLIPVLLCGEFEEIPDASTIQILSPDFSETQTKRIKLNNGLTAYLVSDPKLQKSGAALVVNVGSWDEPKDHPGLAHFLEHMLFMGTKKFPQESEYDRYITEHGGMSNAFTADDITAFMFVINDDYFEGALDRFSHFFKEPIFDPSGVSRELKAIDQEYAKNLGDDDFKEYYILKSLADPDHPFSRFGMGNIESLKNSSRDDLIAWYNTHYSSDLMHMTVYSTMPMDKLIALVDKEFSEIPRKKADLEKETRNALPDSLKSKMLIVRPTKDLQSLTVTWELPTKFTLMRDTMPQNLVSVVIGEEGPGSLLALLKEEHLAESLKAGVLSLASSSLLFNIQIDLTNEGAKNTDRVIELLFQEIALLQKEGIPQYIFEDLHQIQKTKYQLQSRKDLFMLLMENAGILMEEDLSTFPEKSYVIQQYNPKDTEELLKLLTPRNAIFTREIPNYQHPELVKEKWLGGQYRIESISEDLLNQWTHAEPNPALHLPKKNQFIPNRLTVRNVPPADFPTPIAVIDNEFGKVYFAADPFYKVPKVSIEFLLRTPKISLKNPRSIVLADYYVKAATEAIKEISYPASVAGLSFHIHRVDDKIYLSMDGFDEKAIPYMYTVIEVLKSMTITEHEFGHIQNELQRSYTNALKDSPLKQAHEILKSALYKNYPTDQQKLQFSQRIGLRHFKLFTKHLFNQLYVEGMVYGNISEKQTKEMGEKIISSFAKTPFLATERTKPEVISLLKQQEPLIIDRKIDMEGNAAMLAIDNGTLTPKSRAVQQIINRALSEPFFAELRTKQQTGYLVFNSPEELEKNLFTIFAVQSTTHSARDLIARFELFLENYLQNLTQELPEDRFENIKNSFITQLKQKPKSYTEMGSLLEKLAFEYDGDFQWLDKRIKAFETLSYSDFIKEATATLGRQNKGRLAILITGTSLDPSLINYRTVKNLKFLHSR